MSKHIPSLETPLPAAIKRQRTSSPPPANVSCALRLFISRAEGLERSKLVKDPRIYRTYAWVVPEGEVEYSTDAAIGSPDPSWGSECTIPIGLCGQHKFLNLEVCRESSRSDPGTSTGQVLVGTARIRLPELGQKHVAWFELKGNGSAVRAAFIHAAMMVIPASHAQP